MKKTNKTNKNNIVTWSACLLIFSCPLFANQKIDNLAANLVEKRSQVDTLSTELEIEKSELQNQMAALRSQRTDLSRQLKAEETKLSESKRALEQVQQEIKKNKVPLGELKPVLLEMASQLQTYIKSGLPFQQEQRVNEIAHIVEMLKTEKISPEKAVSKLWSLLESEFRLSRENGMYQQTIEVSGEKHLAQVVKLGMTMMYFKISESQVGLAQKNGDNWSYAMKTRPNEIEKINYLFDIFTKKIRTGYFEIPR